MSRDLTLTHKERSDILRKRAAKERRRERQPKIDHAKAKPGRERDRDYLAWLHEDMPCVACLILGPAPAEQAFIEAAHQKANDAARGWQRKMGVRSDDRTCVPLCAHHHRLGPMCCDPAQAKFWAVLGVDVIDFAAALYAAFTAGQPGAPVVRRFAAMGAVRTLHRNDAA